MDRLEKLSSHDFRWTADESGEWLCIRAQNARKLLATVEEGKLYTVELKPHRERRSLDANAYAWVLMGKLAEKLKIPQTVIYQHFVREIGGNRDTLCVKEEAAEKLVEAWKSHGLGWVADTMPSKLPGCVNVIVYYGSSTYDTAQMSRMIDLIVDECKEQGIETLTPDKLAAMKEAW